MKRTNNLVALMTGVALVLAASAFAQMSDHSDHQLDKQTAEASSSGGCTGMKGDMKGMLGDKSGGCQMMAGDFNRIQKHLDKMIQMDDLTELKAELVKHRNIMSSMQSTMSEHRDKCKEMMSMMNFDGKMHNEMMDKSPGAMSCCSGS